MNYKENEEKENQEQIQQKEKPPVIFLILRIIGIVMIVAGILLVTLGFTVGKKVDEFGISSPNFAMMGIGGALLVLSTPMLFWSFIPAIRKEGLKFEKYHQKTNRKDLEEIAQTNAEIYSKATETYAKSVKKGVSEIKFCKHCGAEIDKDSKFCSNCGKEL